MKTLNDFLSLCRNNPALDIYETLHCANEEVREAVFDAASKLGVKLHEEPEPTRASLIALGREHGIQTLIDY